VGVKAAGFHIEHNPAAHFGPLPFKKRLQAIKETSEHNPAANVAAKRAP
jgi:hypothetical protein